MTREKTAGLPRFCQRSNRGQAGPRRAFVQLLRPFVAVVALIALMADDGIGRDEFLCEVAVVHLSECCPEFPARSLYCVRSGCDSQVTPDISEDRAQCLRSKSCDELKALGACSMDTWEPVPSCVMPCSPKVPPCR
jgi:hypothetical protein